MKKILKIYCLKMQKIISETNISESGRRSLNTLQTKKIWWAL